MFRAVILTLAILVILIVGCGSATETSTPDVSSSANKTAGGAEKVTEGGTLTIDIQGKPATIPLDFAELANTDVGYPDFVEFGGPGTYLAARIDPKMPSGEDDAYYKPVVGRELPMDVPMDMLRTPREITIPGQGKYPVTGGSITMEKYRLGTDARDFWEGRISVIIQTAQGPVTLSGTFNVTIVPTW